MQPSNDLPFLSAHIRTVRLQAEHCELAEGQAQGNVQVALHDSSNVEIRWELSPAGEPMLGVLAKIDAIFLASDAQTPLITYKSVHLFHFHVAAYTGFDPQEDLPTPAVSPYIEMGMWLARTRAQASIRSMGVANFNWPLPGMMQATAAQEEKLASPTKKGVSKKRASRKVK